MAKDKLEAVQSKLFSGMRKKLTKKYDDIIIDLEEPSIWADSGNYVLNHILSGQFGRGYPAGRITQLFGESGSGKSFLVASTIARAQKDGYMVVILDSEQAMSQDYLEKIGVDTADDKLMTVQAYTVEQTQDLMVDVLNDVKEARAELDNKDDLKLMLVVDSLGLLSSNKAAADAEKGNAAADMGTKAKALVRMFNAVTQKVGITEAVTLMTNHGAMEVGTLFPQMKPTGGRCLVAGTKVKTESEMKNIEDIQIGDMVKTHMDRFKPVEKLFQFDDLEVLEVELDNGQVIKMTPEHKMLVERNGKKEWIQAKDLTTEDSLLELVETVSANLESEITKEVEA